jgi:SAM-dependent methyltransferase
MCKAIENSTPEQKAKYLEGMAKTVPHKAELVLPWLKSGSVVDLGCADGDFTIQLARKQGFVTGIDMSADILEIARERGAEANIYGLNFKQGKAEDFSVTPVDNVVASSILHEVFSYGNGIQSVVQAVNNIHKNLKKGGRLIIRDFVKPKWKIVGFAHKKSDMVEGHTFEDMFRIGPSRYKTEWWAWDNVELPTVYEYIFHKDFHTNWETEVRETYGFATIEDMKSILTSAGFNLIHTAEIDNQWIIENRLKGRVTVDWKDEYPKYQMLLVAEKA